MFDVDHHDRSRANMIQSLRDRGIRDPRVLEAMDTLPRHFFVPRELAEQAYDDRPLPIGFEQTISQPYIVAITLEALRIRGIERVLDVGTGSGYQAALLGYLAREVFSVEIIPKLFGRAQELLARLGLDNVHIVHSDGNLGYRTAQPYDAIAVAAASPIVPGALFDQLAEDGRLVLPVGTPATQDLLMITKRGGHAVVEALGACVFVPMVTDEGMHRLE
jgi:protein-L-isoaspartate(D-aspartate) O-methyltransferase